MGLDTEFIPENSYYPELALIQIAVADACFIVDPLAPLDLSPLYEVINAEEVIVVVHAGAQDMGIFFHRTNAPPRQVFDTQIAASFLGMGHQIAYAALVQRLFNVSLAKGESFTNWLKRPLKPEQLRYALDDVAYLVQAFEKMRSLLEQQGRLSWALDEMHHFEDASFYTASASNPEKRVKKSGQMKGRDLVVLEALANWREVEAQTKNLPRKKILSDYTIVDLARRKPDSVGELLSLRSADQLARRYANVLIRIIAEAHTALLPDKPQHSGSALDDEQKLLVEFISFCLKGFCLRENLASTMIATRSELESLVMNFYSGAFSPEHHRILNGWRKEAVGENLLKCLRGQLGVRFNANDHRLQFF